MSLWSRISEAIAALATGEGLSVIFDRLRAAHPGVEIESCASGGGRIDAGILARTHRVWLSDCRMAKWAILKWAT